MGSDAISLYNYTIKYKPGSSLSNADALSRLPEPLIVSGDGLTGDHINLINHLSTTGFSAINIRKWTETDPILAQVKRAVMRGWPDQPTEEKLKPYYSRRNELSVLDGCVLWGARVVVPPQGQKLVLDELHDTHPGVSRMKSLARSYVWWPKMNEQVEEVVKTCAQC